MMDINIENSGGYKAYKAFCPEFSKKTIPNNCHANHGIVYKKGLSPIIATVLLILLTVSAATFIAGFLYNYIAGLMEETKCNNYKDYFEFDNELGYNCYETAGNNKTYKISIAAKNVKPEIEAEVKGFGLIFYKQGDSEVVKVFNGSNPNNIKMLSNSSAQISIPKHGETRSYNYSNENIFSSAKVYAILKSKECESVESINLLAC